MERTPSVCLRLLLNPFIVNSPFIYRFEEDENGEPTLDNIEDDDEYELAADAFDEWLDEQDFEELED